MNEILNFKQLIELLSYLPVETPLINAPKKPHAYVSGKMVAMVSGETIFDQNPTQTVGEFVERLKNMIGLEYNPTFKVTEKTQIYLVTHSHQAGRGVVGFKVTSQGVQILKEPY